MESAIPINSPFACYYWSSIWELNILPLQTLENELVAINLFLHPPPKNPNWNPEHVSRKNIIYDDFFPKS